MTAFSRAITPQVDNELQLAFRCRVNDDAGAEFTHLENAHVLGQQSTWQHTRVHYLMLCWGLRNRDYKEVRGQLLRLIGAATKTAIGLVPTGNTGGSNISPFKTLPVRPELAMLIQQAKSTHS